MAAKKQKQKQKQASKDRKEKSGFEKDRKGFQKKGEDKKDFIDPKTAKEPGALKEPGKKKRQTSAEPSGPEAKEKENGEAFSDSGKQTAQEDTAENDFFESDREGGTTQDGEYRKRDTYHQSHKKQSYQKSRVHREHQSRERSRYEDGTAGKSDKEAKSDSRFNEFKTKEDTFTQGTESTEGTFKVSKKLDRLENKADRATGRTQRAKDKLPKKKEYRLERQFDDTTGKAKYVLVVDKVDKPFKKENLAVSAFRRVETEERNFVHGKIAEHEKENSAVEGAHKTEQTVERSMEYVINHRKNKELKQRKKVAKLENKQFKA